MNDNGQESRLIRRICYLTGRQLKTVDEARKDYLLSLASDNKLKGKSEEPLPPGKEPIDPDRESLEHIIPNAIGGKIKSKNILSHSANQQLNREIDIDFAKIFASFTSRLSITTDRNTKPSIRAFHLDRQVELIFKDGKYFPRKPFYDAESKTIYAHPLKNAENYRERLLQDGTLFKGENVNISDDMAGKIEMPLGIGNKNFKQGMAKIAIGYAILNGVDRSNLDAVLDFNNKKIGSRIPLIPSLPTSTSENVFEQNVDKSPHYPCHALTLCGHGGVLYCHVELFNAFQWYVVLSYNYHGEDIFQSYTYDLINDEEISRDDYIASVNLPCEFPGIKNFRKPSAQILEQLAISMIVDRKKLEDYNHFKFYQLSNFTNEYFILNKAIALGILNFYDVERGV